MQRDGVPSIAAIQTPATMQSLESCVRPPLAVIGLALLIACRGSSIDAPASTAPSASVEVVRQAAHPITGAASDYDPLLALVGDARFVLLGEQTHGTHEFYRERARITQRLITEKGFTAVAIEGDWPDAYRVNAYVRGLGSDATPEQALGSFTRFPQWMWRNEDVRDLVRWLRQHNDANPTERDVGFYGLDVYSLYPSIDEVLRYLGAADAAAAARVRALYACFEPHRRDPQVYGASTRGGSSCERQARDALAELETRAATRPADPAQAEALFSALRNAHAVANAEAYFRTSYAGGMSSWNVRDQRMAEGVAALETHLTAANGRPAKIVVWSHNTHTGDARLTESGEAGELNIGQLMRERHGNGAVLVGFFTYTGTVFAASEWDEPGRVKNVRRALPESYSALFHATGVPNFVLPLRGGPATEELSQPRLERAIGVIYLPETERQSHYFTSQLGPRFDAATFFDVTRAVTPLP